MRDRREVDIISKVQLYLKNGFMKALMLACAEFLTEQTFCKVVALYVVFEDEQSIRVCGLGEKEIVESESSI